MEDHVLRGIFLSCFLFFLCLSSIVYFYIHCPHVTLCSATRTTKCHATSEMFFVFSCNLYFIPTCFFLSLYCPVFCLLSLLATRNTNIPVPGGIFLYSVVLCTSSVFVSLTRVSCILPLLATRNKNIHASGGILFCSLSVLYPYFFVLIVLAVPFFLTVQHKHPCFRRDSNPQPQQEIGHRPSP